MILAFRRLRLARAAGGLIDLVLPAIRATGAELLASMGHDCSSWRALTPGARDASLTELSRRIHVASLGASIISSRAITPTTTKNRSVMRRVPWHIPLRATKPLKMIGSPGTSSA